MRRSPGNRPLKSPSRKSTRARQLENNRRRDRMRPGVAQTTITALNGTTIAVVTNTFKRTRPHTQRRVYSISLCCSSRGASVCILNGSKTGRPPPLPSAAAPHANSLRITQLPSRADRRRLADGLFTLLNLACMSAASRAPTRARARAHDLIYFFSLKTFSVILSVHFLLSSFFFFFNNYVQLNPIVENRRGFAHPCAIPFPPRNDIT